MRVIRELAEFGRVHPDRAADGAIITINAGAAGSEVEISISIAPELQSAKSGEETFSLLLARTLIELSGAYLVENHTETGGWLPSARFARATQRDFFSGTGML